MFGVVFIFTVFVTLFSLTKEGDKLDKKHGPINQVEIQRRELNKYPQCEHIKIEVKKECLIRNSLGENVNAQEVELEQ